MTTPSNLESKPRQDDTEHALDDQNLTHSILEDFETSNVSDSSVDLQLRFQRLLAESALESSLFDTSKNHGISANEFTLGTSTPRLNNSSFSIFGSADKKKHDEFEALFKKYYSEDFVPAEQATERLMADEIAWKKEYGFSPPVNDKLNLSCFSGIIGDAEISLRSVTGTDAASKNKVTPEEYFNLKTDQMGSLDRILNNKERPNFGNEIESPIGNRERIAFVQDTVPETPQNANERSVEEPRGTSVDKTLTPKPGNKIENLNVTPIEDASNTLSVSSIEDILSKHLQDTPGTIAKSILNPKSKTKSTISQAGSVSMISEQASSFFDNVGDTCPIEGLELIRVNVTQTEHETYVGSKANAFFHIQNKSTRWLKCSMSVHQIIYNKSFDAAVEQEMKSLIQFPEVSLVGPSQNTVEKVVIVSILPGNFEICVNVTVEDAVTQTTKNYVSSFKLTSKMPKVTSASV